MSGKIRHAWEVVLGGSINISDEPLPYECPECSTRYWTPSAAETCAEQDELESKQTRSAHRRKNRHHID